MAAAVVRFHRLALREAQTAYRWYALRSLRAAQAFQDQLDRAVQWIAAAPNSWPVYRGSNHWIRARGFPYIVYYRVLDPTSVLVKAVAHTRRRTGYWLRRTQP
jgi:plasmid stabilization system protein ParE